MGEGELLLYAGHLTDVRVDDTVAAQNNRSSHRYQR